MAANLEVVSLSFLSQQGDRMDFVVLCNIFQGSYEKKNCRRNKVHKKRSLIRGIYMVGCYTHSPGPTTP